MISYWLVKAGVNQISIACSLQFWGGVHNGESCIRCTPLCPVVRMGESSNPDVWCSEGSIQTNALD